MNISYRVQRDEFGDLGGDAPSSVRNWPGLSHERVRGWQIGWIWDASAHRATQPELGALVFAVQITASRASAAQAMAARWDLSPQEVLDSPHLLAGSPAQIADQLNGCRERFGITCWVVQDIIHSTRYSPTRPAN